MSERSEQRLAEICEALSWFLARKMPLKSYEIEHLAKLADPSAMKRGTDAFIEKYREWEYEDED